MRWYLASPLRLCCVWHVYVVPMGGQDVDLVKNGSFEMRGANALLMYSYNPVEKMDWRNSFDRKWKDICECADEIAKVSDIILSVGTPPVLGSVPKTLSVRVWRIGKRVHLLVCNATGKKLNTSFSLGEIKASDMHTIFGGGVRRNGDTVTVDFAPEGYAFLGFR